jgi:hypothetical protein
MSTKQKRFTQAVIILQETQEDNEKIKKALNLSLDEIIHVLENKQKITDRTKMATATFMGYTRLRSTQVHQRALEVAVARKDVLPLPPHGEGE